MSATPHHPPRPPSPWVERFAPLVPAGGTVLDLACGGGRHGRLFLERGHRIVFVDRDTAGVEDLAGRPDVEIIAADLEADRPWPLADRRFAGVVVANYLWRPILPRIAATAAPGGVLIYETFARGNEAFGRPRNPDFLLEPGELFEAFRGGFRILAYGQCVRETPGPAVIQHIAAVKPP